MENLKGLQKSNDQPKVKYRGAIDVENTIQHLSKRDLSFIKNEKLGFYLSYVEKDYQFHIVDRFASFPLFYCIKDGIPYVSEKVDELIPYLDKIKFDSDGYMGSGMLLSTERRSDLTPFQGIKRILPGHYLEYSNTKTSLIQYWSFLDLKNQPFEGTYEEATEELGFLIKQAIRRCYEFAPDAALHLSGGLDSGTIASFMGQFSNQHIHTYSAHNKDAPTNNDEYESGYIKKYQKFYPNLKSHLLQYPKKQQEVNKFFCEAGNWLAISENNYECLIAKDVKERGIKYILSGLGGDELASYGNNSQYTSISVSNDWSANLYAKWYIEKRTLWTKYAHSLSRGKINQFLDDQRTYSINTKIQNKAFWYRDSFKKKAIQSFRLPPIWLTRFPASFNYRLKLLNSSYFTIRSDNWNFIGRQFGVDYLHPLLDADLVNFAAQLPRHFFVKRPARELFKKSLMTHIPKELLMGIKRPAYMSEKSFGGQKELVIQIERTQKKLMELDKTFASTIFDYSKIISLLNNFIALLKKIPSDSLGTIFNIQYTLAIANITIRRGKYLNRYFQNES